MTNERYHENRFYSSLKDIFVGAKIEGKSGFINLMHIKSRYFTEGVFPRLKDDIDQALEPFPNFREELFDKLYTFFKRYFSESGSIYFSYTPLNQNIYEKIYTDERDVILFWKTHMLYYVKTDRIFNNIKVSIEDFSFYFDTSLIEYKRVNEKKEIIFVFKNVAKDGTLIFNTLYSERGRVTKIDNILREIRKEGVHLPDETLINAFRVFEKQSEVDYFINKNARDFLEEQFNLWIYQYLFAEKNIWSSKRLAQLQVLKEIAYKVIGFISQFEDELVKIWNKPKFVRDSNYVIALNKVAKNLSLLKKILNHPNMQRQINEWYSLGMTPGKFCVENLIIKEEDDISLNPKYQTIPIDTKYFPDLELEILSLFENLDEELNGWLIFSENYQALNTIKKKFQKRVQTIYIDPPFNTGNDFDYLDKFANSTWMSIMNDRIMLGVPLLKKTGTFWLHLDENANVYGKEILQSVFSQITEIIFDTNATKDEEADLFGYKSFGDNFQLKHQTLFYCRKNNYFFRKLWKPNRNLTKLDIGWLDLIAFKNTDKPKKITDFDYKIEKWKDEQFVLEPIEINEKIYPVGDIWNDIFSFTQSEMRISESFGFTSAQKPENLLRRIIQSSTMEGDMVLDYFLGIGTTIAVAHKLNRKWIGIEMGNHFSETYPTSEGEKLGVLGRMKWVVFGDRNMTVLGLKRRPHLSKDIGWEGGGFFKYFYLEQYEDSLNLAHYKDSDLFNNPDEDPYHSYVFLRDLKLLESVEIDTDTNQVHFKPEKLYNDIDIAETLSLVRGKWIKRITKDFVEFVDGEVLSLINPDWETIKPMVWWS